MSEVKPTLVSYEAVEETASQNSWLSNFPSGKWIDAQGRGWYWIMINAVSVPSAYEYKIRFDVPTENTILVFPFVVKTSDKGVKRVFINGVEYRVRSKENYGDRFVVSGQEFSFKVATKYKLTKRTAPIITIENKQAVFKTANSLEISSYYVLRQLFSEFRVISTIDTLLVRTLHIPLVFISSAFVDCQYIVARNTSGLFYNINTIEANQLATRTFSSSFYNTNTIDARPVSVSSVPSLFYNINAIETDYMVARSVNPTFTNSNLMECEYVITHSVLSEFININILSAPVIANCRDTSWMRFGGVWQSCETWMPPT
jgi:hypothetical protein